jgi:hypothetical protein
VTDRARDIGEILREKDLSRVSEKLEDILERLRSNPVPPHERMKQSLEDPILMILVQNNCHNICRNKVFCPAPECQAEPKREAALMTHIRHKHPLRGETVKHQDAVRYFIAAMFPEILETRLETLEGQRLKRDWNVERCHIPGCDFLQEKHTSVENHVKKMHKKQEDINELGWFWGILRAAIQTNPFTTVREMLNDGELYQCGVQGCDALFASEGSIKQHFSQKHSDETREEWEAPWRKLRTKTELIAREEKETRDAEESEARQREIENPIEQRDEPDPASEIMARVAQRKTQSDREEGVLWVDPQERRTKDREEDRRGEEDKEILRQEYIRKREECLERVRRGVNIPQLSQRMMAAIKPGLRDLFRFEINPVLEELMPVRGDWEEWLAFEGAYEQALDKIRRHIYVKLGRNPDRIYGRRPIDPKKQKIREEENEIIRQRQTTRTNLSIVKAALEEISKGEEEARGEEIPKDEEETEAEQRRRRARWTTKIVPVLRTIPEQRRIEVFGTTEMKGLWDEMNTFPDHRQKVIDWVESLIVSEVAGEIEGIGKQMHSQKVQEAYRTTKSIAMKRYIDKRNSPQCEIPRAEVEDHYRGIWAKPAAHFKEAEEGSPLFLEAKIPEEATTEMEEFMMDEENIREVIRSRQDLSACGTDGISCRVLKQAGEDGVNFMKKIIQATGRCGKIFTTWKEARTILIHKKGDKGTLQNWRPISITNCIYRIYTCLMAKCFQKVNEKCQIFTDTQKGFIAKTNGCSEHGILLNELFQHAKRNRQCLAITAIDFSNAFGSVPHELIMCTMKQRNFPTWTVKIVEDMYTGASSTVELKGERSEPIAWKRGVKQGCPLSPLLFNLCLEPLLQLINRANRGEGAFVRNEQGESLEFRVQAYADDVILISQKAEGIKGMLRSLGSFVRWSQMEVNAKKCATASYLIDSKGHRCSLRESLRFNDQEIPNLTLNQSLKYLGVPLTARRKVKLQAVNEKITEMEILLQKIMESPLLTVQKIDAVKTFLIPSLDFLMLNGEVGGRQLNKLDQKIRAAIDEQLKIRGLPIECHHMSWRDGGLSYPSLVDRSNVLALRSFAQMVLSKDRKVREVMGVFVEDERRYRKIEIEKDEETEFLNWKDEKGSHTGTTSLVARTRKAVKKLGINMKLTEDGLVVKREGSVHKTKKATSIGRFLTQRIVRKTLAQRVLEHPMHGATFVTLKENEASNKFLTNIYTKRSNAFFRFMVGGRADCLPTPANISKWYQRPEEQCRRCGENVIPTLAHIINQCRANSQLFTKRHNRLVDVIRETMEKYIGDEMVGPCVENAPLAIEGLSEEQRRKRPDLSLVWREGQEERIEIIEITCPYGKISHGENTLKHTFEYKRNKYAALAAEVETITGDKVRVIPIIVSSFGAVYGESMKLLKQILKCEDEKLKKIAVKMSEAVMIGSFELWRKYTSTIERNMERKHEETMEVEVNDDNGFADDEGMEEEEIEVRLRAEETDERGDEMAAEAAGLEEELEV